MFRHWILRSGWFVLFLTARLAVAGELYPFSHENVLGTSLDMKIEAESEEAARLVEAAVLAEIERLRSIFSRHDPQSELRRWSSHRGESFPISHELYEMLQLSDSFRVMTKGAFDPSVQLGSELWQRCERENRIPTAAEMASTVHQIAFPDWKLVPDQRTAVKLSATPLTFDAIAKGYILDRACEVALQQPQATGILLNIGGDLKCQGTIGDSITIADPLMAAENNCGLANVRLSNQALATSGGYHRGFSIQGRHYSHLLDPRTATPVDHIISASVIAREGATADALATAVSVMSVREALELCDSLPGVSCLLLLEDRSLHTSQHWPRSATELTQGMAYTAASSPSSKSGELWSDRSKLQIDFEINNPSQGGRYRRPYVAVWIEDPDHFPVRTLALWLQTAEPGPRWHRDLRQWYKDDAMRKLVDGKSLLGRISAATKPPGKYKLIWDGTDDHGQPVKKGKYTLLLEAAREHGTYQLIKKEIEISDQAFHTTLEGNVEIKSVLLDYQLGVE